MSDTKKRTLFTALIAVLVVAVVIVSVVISLEGSKTGGSEVKVVSTPAGEIEKIEVMDIYEGKVTRPFFEKMAVSTYEKDKFISTNNIITYDSEDAKLGIDVSGYQGDINWEQVKASGVDFAIIRVGYRGNTQGALHIDSKFKQNMEGAIAAGLDVGVYFFATAITVKEAEEEATFVLEHIRNYPTKYPIVYDWERGHYEKERNGNSTGAEVTAFTEAFCKKIEQAGRKAAFYTNKSMAYNFFNLNTLANYDMWYAEYMPAPSLYYDFKIWQYTEEGSVPGIEVPVDMNISFKKYS